MSSVLDQLYATRLQKLEEQKAISTRMNEILTKPNGLNDSAKLTMKSLQAAIAVAKQPGYFEYYKSSDEVKQIEDNKILNNLARQVQKLHSELEQLGNEIAVLEAKRHVPKISDIPLTSLNQWFDMYGKAKDIGLKDQISQFVPAPRVYGGTSHHRAFKSQAATMKVGRCTR